MTTVNTCGILKPMYNDPVDQQFREFEADLQASASGYPNASDDLTTYIEWYLKREPNYEKYLIRD